VKLEHFRSILQPASYSEVTVMDCFAEGLQKSGRQGIDLPTILRRMALYGIENAVAVFVNPHR
jgi:hypothetical protein